jgi:CotH kinase protein
MRRIKAGAIIFVLLFGFAPAASASEYVEGTDTAATVFDPLNVIDIDLNVSQDGINRLWNAAKEYVPAEMRVKLATSYTPYFPIELRLKGGWGSLRDLNGKAGFKIKIPRDHRAKVGGLKKLTLNNMVQDASFVHEAMSYRLFRAMGIASPRVGYSTVSLNGSEYGLYANIETPDDQMLSRWFPSTKHLFEGSYWMDVWPDNEGAFEVDEGDPSDLSDLRALAQASYLSGTAWYDAFQRLTYSEQMLTNWAVELYIGHWDGYAHVIKNNYFLHSDVTGRFSMLPWGTDQTWNDYLDFFDTWDRSIMFSKCMEVADCRFSYEKKIFAVNKMAISLNLPKFVDDIEEVIEDYIFNDPRKETWFEATFEWRESAKYFAVARGNQVNEMFNGYEPEAPVARLQKTKKRTSIKWREPYSSYFPITHYEVMIKAGKSPATIRKVKSLQFAVNPPKVRTVFKVRTVNTFTHSEWSSNVTVARAKKSL